MIYTFLFSLWRNQGVDLDDLDLWDFEYFEKIVTENRNLKEIKKPFSVFVLSEEAVSLIASIVYDYGFGKQINLKNSNRWVKNFYSEVNSFLLEYARYLQSYFRDVNKNIDKTGTTHGDTLGDNVTGGTTTNKNSSFNNSQGIDTNSSSNDTAVNRVGDTLTILDNQTTSTQYLASKNDESFSTGDITEQNSTNESQENKSNIEFSVGNNANLQKTKDKTTVDTSGTYSPLDIALKESQFNFQKWRDDFHKLMDNYFILGGSDYA